MLVSPLVRARQTAAPLLAALGRDEEVDPWLEEIRDPKWHGTPAEKAAEAYAELRGRPAEERWSGLDRRRVGARVRRRGSASARRGFLADARRGAQRGRPADLADRGARAHGSLLVAHAGTNSVTIGHLLGLQATPWEWDRFVLGHASISRLEAMPLHDGYTFCLSKLSDVEHLAARRSHPVERRSHGVPGDVYRRADDRRRHRPRSC